MRSGRAAVVLLVCSTFASLLVVAAAWGSPAGKPAADDLGVFNVASPPNTFALYVEWYDPSPGRPPGGAVYRAQAHELLRVQCGGTTVRLDMGNVRHSNLIPYTGEYFKGNGEPESEIHASMAFTPRDPAPHCADGSAAIPISMQISDMTLTQLNGGGPYGRYQNVTGSWTVSGTIDDSPPQIIYPRKGFTVTAADTSAGWSVEEEGGVYAVDNVLGSFSNDRGPLACSPTTFWFDRPDSIDTYPLGTTMVTCYAYDYAGNRSSVKFPVTVTP